MAGLSSFQSLRRYVAEIVVPNQKPRLSPTQNLVAYDGRKHASYLQRLVAQVSSEVQMKRSGFLFLAVSLVVLLSVRLTAQSITSGAITGTVSDPTAALIANANIIVTNQSTGAAASAKTSSGGFYRISFLSPGLYEVEVTAAGFRNARQKVQVHLGQIATADIRLQLGATSEKVSVTAEGPMLQTENANLSTTVGTAPLQGVPNPGNDISYAVQSAPGAVMNTQQGLGNFSTFGLPGTSNLYTVNGMQDNNSFLNVINTGATNLLLGLGEVQELTIINNPYSGEYGGLAGAQVNVVTKSGSNLLHGDARYWWNGRALNANDWFNNHTTPKTPRSFDNANQWSASLGGPVRKDKTFFFLYTEGLRVIIPTSQLADIPSPEFEAATLANLNGMGLTNSAAYYQNVIFPLYHNAPGAASATPVPFNQSGNGGCSGFQFPGGIGTTVPCALQFQSTVNNLSTEWIVSARVDHNLSNRDRIFARFRTDHGNQATFTDVISPLFNVVTNVPQYEGQLGETHVFGSAATNSLVISGSWYGNVSNNRDRAAALALFPTTMMLGDGSLSALGGINYYFPQGRNATQYGLVDDISVLHGRDFFKFGATFQRYDISDLDFPILSSGILSVFTINDFFNGGSSGDLLVQNFVSRSSQPLALYRLGGYVQDEHRFSANLKGTLSLRIDHSSIPVCQTNCFARFPSAFSSLNPDPTTPYNQLIRFGKHETYQETDGILWQPRIGIAWQPSLDHNLVFRGGAGIFADSIPGAIADRIAANPPLVNSFNPRFDNLAPTENSNLFFDAQQANAAFANGFANGASLADFITPGDPFFSPFFIPPNFTNPPTRVHVPRYEEWSLQVQKGWGANTTFSGAYVGNHGIHELVQNNGVNGFCFPSACPLGFTGLPPTPPDPRFGTVNQFLTVGTSNYNGVTLSAQHRFSRGFHLQANYTWSHALDDVSNGGLLNFNFATNLSVLNPEDPANIRRFNYGNADYDVRHYGSLTYVYQLPFESYLLRGWQVSGALFARSELPFTVTDGLMSANLNQMNYGGTVFANFLGTKPPNCDTSAAGVDSTPCLSSVDFAMAATGFGNQRRNQLRGPGFFDTDMAVTKDFQIPGSERAHFAIGVQFFNLFNHPNFDQPVANLADVHFGHIVHTVSTPTTVLGSFLGGDASPRVIRLSAQITF
jgi:hypothetical protein